MDTVPGERVAEGIVPVGTIGAVQDPVPTRTLDVGDALQRGLTLGTDAGRLGFLRGRLRGFGRRWFGPQQRAAATEVSLPMPTAKPAETAGLDEPLRENVQRPATGKLDAWKRVRFRSVPVMVSKKFLIT